MVIEQWLAPSCGIDVFGAVSGDAVNHQKQAALAPKLQLHDTEESALLIDDVPDRVDALHGNQQQRHSQCERERAPPKAASGDGDEQERQRNRDLAEPLTD